MQKLSDRIDRARRERFVGRQAEVELFRTALLADEPPFAVLHIYGPGGAGKTTLLHELARIATELGWPVVHLDARDIEPTSAAIDLAAQAARHAANGSVLLIDTYEVLDGLDGWMRRTFLPQLPANSLVVMAGRQPPSAWREDGAWAELTRVVALDNLQIEESQAYLTARGVPAEQHAALLAFTRGHPLALSLVAELYAQGNGAMLGSAPAAHDVIRSLMERFVRDAPTAQHRQALELCAIARTTTEAMLANLFDAEAAFLLFQWLRQLSFMEQGPYGIFPHDLVREVLDADLHWRNPNHYADLQQVALRYLRRAAQAASGQARQRLRMDTIYINRRAPGMRDFFVWDAADAAYAESAQAADFPAIIAMVLRHEGEASAAIARHWLARQPAAFLIYRTNDGEAYGCMAHLALEHATAEDAAIDPAVAAALAHVAAHHPIQPGDAISHMRFWMARESYQLITVAVNVTAANCVIHWTTTPRLVWSFVTMSNPTLMAPHFESIHFQRTPAADFTVGGRQYGVFSHNWALMPLTVWQIDTRHADLGIADAGRAAAGEAKASPAPVLSKREFAAALRQALRDYTRPDLLAANPLLNTALLTERTPAALQALLGDAVTALNQNPKDAKLYRALWRTYIEPEATQEQAAERLDLPFNTYRYHLTNGIDRLTTMLWQRLQDPSA